MEQYSNGNVESQFELSSFFPLSLSLVLSLVLISPLLCAYTILRNKAMESVIGLAVAMGRTLVMPPQKKMYGKKDNPDIMVKCRFLSFLICMGGFRSCSSI